MAGYLLCFLLMVPSSSGITLTGSSSTAALGQSTQFTCTVTGSSTTQHLTFRRDGTDVCTVRLNPCQQFRATPGYSCSCGQSGVYHMEIANVSLADDGTWTCTLAQTSNNVTLTVYYGPFNNVTVDKASPVSVIEEVTVSLTARCSAVCYPDCRYTWSKGTQQVSDNRDLPVGSLRRGQEGEYRCTARNTATGATADSQTLTVNVQWYPAPPTHNCPSWIVPGQTISCTCQTSDRGNPAGTVQWISPEGQPVSSSGSSSVQLNLTSIPRSDTGLTYICRVDNSLPSSNSDVTYIARIAYLGSPQLTFDKDDTEGNTSVTVTCTVESNPTARMTVENIGSETKPASGITNNFTITSKMPCLFNRFRCTVENKQTNTQASTARQLNIACAPRHDSSKQTVNRVTGQLKTTVSLVANVIASPLPNFTWFLYQEMTPVLVVDGTGGNVVLTKGLQSVLNVYINREEDYGIYRVVVRNRVGSTSLFFILAKDVPPPPPPPPPPGTSCNILPVAVGEGAVIVVLVVIVVVIMHRRSRCGGLPQRNVPYDETTVDLQRDKSTTHGRAVLEPLPDETDTYPIPEINAYSAVYEKGGEKQTYTERKELETMSVSSTLGNDAYESLQVGAPQVYEDIKTVTRGNRAETK